MNLEQISEKLQKLLVQAANNAKDKGRANVDTIDILEVFFKDDVLDGLYNRLGIDKKKAIEIIEREEKI